MQSPPPTLRRLRRVAIDIEQARALRPRAAIHETDWRAEGRQPNGIYFRRQSEMARRLRQVNDFLKRELDWHGGENRSEGSDRSSAGRGV